MAISAQRFEFLDKETNVPVKDFLTADSSSIFNELLPGMPEVGGALSALMNGGDVMGALGDLAKSSGVMDALGGLVGGEGGLSLDSLGGLGDMIRSAKDQLSTVVDFDKLSELDLDKMGESLMSGNFSMDSLSGLGSAFKLDFLGEAGGSMSGLSGLISGGKELMAIGGSMTEGMDMSKMLDGIMGNDSENSRKVTNVGHQQRVLTAVGSMGMQANLPNVFSSVSSQVNDPGQLNVLGGNIATRAARNGSVYGVMEIANSPIGGTVTSTVPDINAQFMSGFQYPAGLDNLQLHALFDESLGAMETMQPGWSVQGYQGGSVVNATAVPARPTPWTSLLAAQTASTVPVVDGTVTAPSSTALLLAGQQMKQKVMAANVGYGSDPFGVLRTQNPQWSPLLQTA